MKDETIIEEKISEDKDFELKHLTLVDSDLEAERIITMLASEGIATIKKFKDTGSFLNIVAAVNYQGVDIYVSEEYEATAKLLIQPIDELPEAYEEEMPLDGFDQEALKHRGLSMKWIIRLGYLLPMALVTLYTLWMGISNWFK